ncbi:MAG: hypothetical protein IMF11_15075, partial [Proteobacteria bacterium]|nr:hypothetical protein [Pseudomonadota bacterium]
MKYKSQTIPLVLSLSLAAVLILGTAVPQPSAMAMEIPELQDPGISPLDDSPPPLPTDGVKKVDGLSSGADVPPPHSDPKPEEYPIPNSEMPTMEDHHVVSRRDLSAEGSSIQVPAAPDGWTTIMFEDFEGAFPGAGWNVYDGNSTDNMEYYWDDDDYRAHNGSWSAWPANGGADGLDPLFFYYPDNMDTWMWYGPFDLSDAVDAELQFYYWLQSEWSYDFFSWYASPDGGADITGYIRSGSSGGWVSENYDLTAFLGDASVWISFHFESDATNTDEGVYVDDILLRKKLSRPDIYISPTSLTSKQAPDQVKTLNLEIGNNGDAPLDWSIVESNT